VFRVDQAVSQALQGHALRKRMDYAGITPTTSAERRSSSASAAMRRCTIRIFADRHLGRTVTAIKLLHVDASANWARRYFRTKFIAAHFLDRVLGPVVISQEWFAAHKFAGILLRIFAVVATVALPPR
jgi:hypothetical protein